MIRNILAVLILFQTSFLSCDRNGKFICAALTDAQKLIFKTTPPEIDDLFLIGLKDLRKQLFDLVQNGENTELIRHKIKFLIMYENYLRCNRSISFDDFYRDKAMYLHMIDQYIDQRAKDLVEEKKYVDREVKRYSENLERRKAAQMIKNIKKSFSF